jgi:hypothetical protein
VSEPRDDITEGEWFDRPTTLGLTIYMEKVHKLGPDDKHWSLQARQAYVHQLRKVVEDHSSFKRNSWRPSDVSATVVPQFNWSDETPRLPTSVIVWLNGWYDDPTPEDQFHRSYAEPDPFEMRRYLEKNGYHVSEISYGYDPVMAS